MRGLTRGPTRSRRACVLRASASATTRSSRCACPSASTCTRRFSACSRPVRRGARSIPRGRRRGRRRCWTSPRRASCLRTRRRRARRCESCVCVRLRAQTMPEKCSRTARPRRARRWRTRSGRAARRACPRRSASSTRRPCRACVRCRRRCRRRLSRASRARCAISSLPRTCLTYRSLTCSTRGRMAGRCALRRSTCC